MLKKWRNDTIVGILMIVFAIVGLSVSFLGRSEFSFATGGDGVVLATINKSEHYTLWIESKSQMNQSSSSDAEVLPASFSVKITNSSDGTIVPIEKPISQIVVHTGTALQDTTQTALQNFIITKAGEYEFEFKGLAQPSIFYVSTTLPVTLIVVSALAGVLGSFLATKIFAGALFMRVVGGRYDINGSTSPAVFSCRTSIRVFDYASKPLAGVRLIGMSYYASWPIGVVALHRNTLTLSVGFKMFELKYTDIDAIQSSSEYPFMAQIFHNSPDVPEVVTLGYFALRRLHKAAREHMLPVRIKAGLF